MTGKHQVGEFLYDSGRGMLSHSGDEKKLEPQVNALLKLLVAQAGETVSRDTINTCIWSQRIVSDDALRAMIRKLRDALGDNARNPRYIRTEPLKGYALIAPVVTQSIAEPSDKSRRHWMALASCLCLLGVAAATSWYLDHSADGEGGRIELLTRMTGSEVSPDYSPAGNRLIFSHRANKDDFLQLYVKDLDTQQVQRLTWEPADYANALWSPNGGELIYSRSAGEQLRHFIASFDADRGIVSEEVLSAGDEARRYLLAWSNSERAVYLKDEAQAGAPAGISKLDLETGKLTTITAPSVRGYGDFFARESWNGKMLAVLREVERGKQELLILDKPTGSLLHTRILPRLADRFVWSETDTSLTLSSFSGEIQAFDLVTNQFSLRALPAKGINDVFFQCGRDCLYMRQHNGNFLDLQEQPNPFLNRPLMASQNLDLPGAEDFPIFGHDGQGLFFVEKDTAGIALKYKSSRDQPVTLIELPPDSRIDALQVSPDGNYLAGLLDGRVFLLNVRQPEIQFLTSGADIVGFPYWTLNGSSLEFAKTEKGIPNIYRHTPDTGVAEAVTGGYVAIVPLSENRAIRLDTENNAWLVHGAGEPQKLATLSSLSPNRWQVRNGWLYFTAHEGNLAVMYRVNIETGERQRHELAKNRFRLNFDLNASGERVLFVKSLLAESNLVRVSLN